VEGDRDEHMSSAIREAGGHVVVGFGYVVAACVPSRFRPHAVTSACL